MPTPTRSTHTPGPWKVSGTLISAQGQTVARVLHRYTTTKRRCPPDFEAGATANGTERDANAALIAAAPELVDALENLLADGAGRPKTCGHEYTCICPERQALAALTKAGAAR